jgi:hypothetical protein
MRHVPLCRAYVTDVNYGYIGALGPHFLLLSRQTLEGDDEE